ncbi:hypothetical protein GLOTRDRAFT_124515 [Gloeophyllum trabeum ATCC 11539]|uniref:Uncharacterized protein n=1 Tax=Gloeophyllum trabeum (strain ATCC 11539 / FP-39264 / Madison 617) TaxID=670483 RepID=S7QMY1_GLOTA|nr:uncharacterized protein GLOTRDRAFT_124515 [Gloeophyllum trabeum ATCC 11539]EPQ60767.1 hypothetical protein GLOTRDRAFT_124515 [Gloeophyllum trabeum ATCC 11539]
MYLHPRLADNAFCPPDHADCGPGIVISDHTPGETQDENTQKQVQDSPPGLSQQRTGGQQFGRRTFAGVAILGIVIILGVLIYGIFGKWPRRKIRKWKKQRNERKNPPRRMRSQGVQTEGEDLEKQEEHSDPEKQCYYELEPWATTPATLVDDTSPRLSLALGDGPLLPGWTEKSEPGRIQAEATPSPAEPTDLKQVEESRSVYSVLSGSQH